MKNLFAYLILVCLFASCQSGAKKVERSANDTIKAAPLFPPLGAEEKQKYHQLVDELLKKSLLRTNFNGGILVAKNGEIVYENYVGFHNLKLKDSLHHDIPMQIASTSKTFTSAAILQLVQEGRINLHDTVTRFFPDFPYPGVTIKMLLNHRSGVPEYLNFMDQSPWPRTQLASNQDVMKALFEWKPGRTARPDTRFQYCNTNFVVLASIIEAVSGMSYPDYMRENIFTPLGMTNSFVVGFNDSLVTQSYQPNGALWTLDFSDGAYGDKNIYSTPRDLLKWDQALYAGRILQQHLLDSAYTPYSNERPGVQNYGLGWRMLLLPNGKKVVFHHGRWHGFNSAFARLTDEKVTVIILGNRYNRAVYTTARRLYSIFGEYGGKEGEE